nr:hypothetical protein [Candidatus Sigynarchaeota archaeon]
MPSPPARPRCGLPSLFPPAFPPPWCPRPFERFFPSMEIVLHGSSDCPARHPAPPARPALARYLYNPPLR